MYAVKYGDINHVKILLDHSANTESKNSKGKTALFKAVKTCKIETVQLLIKYGADPNYVDIDGVPLSFLVLSNKNVNKNPFRFDFSVNSYTMHKPEIVKCLIDNGIDMDLVYQGDTILIYLCKQQYFDSIPSDIQLKIINTSNLNITDDAGVTAHGYHEILGSDKNILRLLECRTPIKSARKI